VNWEFIACLSKLGSVAINGPVTGQRYDIKAQGSWVRQEDFEGLLAVESEIYCLNQGKPVKVKPFFRGRPTSDQMREKPS